MKRTWFYPLLILSTILSATAHFILDHEAIRFSTACLSLLLWAAMLGKATENVAYYAGERLGGLLNATFGNATELIIAIFLIKSGLFEIVKASITGSIIGNLLLVLGLSLFLGGLKHHVQSFNPMLAGHNASMMLLAVISLFIPALMVRDLSVQASHQLSLMIASLLIIGYLLWLYFSLITHKKELGDQTTADHGQEPPSWSKWKSIAWLVGSTLFVALQSEWLVHSIEVVSKNLGWSELFVGAFVIAIIGNAAEHSAAVFLAMKNRIGVAVEIAIGSSLQIALFVAPALVWISLLFGSQMDLLFTSYEIAAIAISVLIASSISRDGTTNWYEGILLLIVYIILGTAFFLV